METNKKIYVLFSFLCLLIILSKTAFAEGTTYNLLAPLGNYTNVPLGTGTGLSGYLATMVKIGVVAAAILAVLMIVIAGFMYILAAGNPGKTERAKNIIYDAIFGILIVIGFFVIIYAINPKILKNSIDLTNIDAVYGKD